MSSISKINTTISDLFESIWNILSYPGQKYDDTAALILDLLYEFDLDPVYTPTVFMNLILLSYWGDFRKWNTQPPFIKHSAVLAAVSAGIMNLWSLLKLLGILDF